jgi:hypothetical protein
VGAALRGGREVTHGARTGRPAASVPMQRRECARGFAAHPGHVAAQGCFSPRQRSARRMNSSALSTSYDMARVNRSSVASVQKRATCSSAAQSGARRVRSSAQRAARSSSVSGAGHSVAGASSDAPAGDASSDMARGGGCESTRARARVCVVRRGRAGARARGAAGLQRVRGGRASVRGGARDRAAALAASQRAARRGARPGSVRVARGRVLTWDGRGVNGARMRGVRRSDARCRCRRRRKQLRSPQARLARAALHVAAAARATRRPCPTRKAQARGSVHAVAPVRRAHPAVGRGRARRRGQRRCTAQRQAGKQAQLRTHAGRTRAAAGETGRAC